MNELHDGQTENELGSDDWSAVCSCGWRRDGLVSELAASKALASHYSDERGRA